MDNTNTSILTEPLNEMKTIHHQRWPKEGTIFNILGPYKQNIQMSSFKHTEWNETNILT